jgi:signal transduction histidine kinase
MNDYIVAKIEDNGAGTDSTNLQKIFESFVSIPTDYSVRGTGIGLYLARQILE